MPLSCRTVLAGIIDSFRFIDDSVEYCQYKVGRRVSFCYRDIKAWDSIFYIDEKLL